jgi:histidine ammonia-lyase
VRALIPAWNVIAIEAACAVWAIHRRSLPLHSLGKGLHTLVAEILPMLPIGTEGLTIFDLAPVVRVLQTKFGQDTCLAV